MQCFISPQKGGFQEWGDSILFDIINHQNVIEDEKRELSGQAMIWINGSPSTTDQRDPFIQIVPCPLSPLSSSLVTYAQMINR
jgi:hypothetical protein